MDKNALMREFLDRVIVARDEWRRRDERGWEEPGVAPKDLRGRWRAQGSARQAAWALVVLGVLVGVITLWCNSTGAAGRFGTLTREFGGNATVELISIAITVLLIDSLVKRDADEREIADLVAQAGSSSNDFALEAVRRLRLRGSLCGPNGALRGARLVKADLRGADLQNADLEDALLFDAHLEGAWLSGAQLRGASLSGAHLDGAHLVSTSLVYTTLRDAALRDADLYTADLGGAYMVDANLEGANLVGATLDGANLEGACLNRASLFRARLRGAKLFQASMRGVDLSGADLKDAYLYRANLQHATLKSASLTQAQLDSTVTYVGAKLPDGLLPDRRPWPRDETE